MVLRKRHGGLLYSEKSRALQTLSKVLDVKREDIITIGDNFNDIDMLEFAGIVVAMGNAPDEIKRRADFCSTSNNDNGVAYTLEKLLS